MLNAQAAAVTTHSGDSHLRLYAQVEGAWGAPMLARTTAPRLPSPIQRPQGQFTDASPVTLNVHGGVVLGT